MDDIYRVSMPKEGVNTLVSQLSLIQIEKIVKELARMREGGSAEKELRDHLARRYSEFDDLTRKKIYQLSLGLTPKDDFDDSDITTRTALNETTLELQLVRLDPRIQEGTMVYLDRRRWVVLATDQNKLLLKQF